MRKTALVGLIILAASLTACSSITNLVVANLSDLPIELKYQIKNYPGPFGLPVTPATKAVMQLSDDSPWTELSADQYHVDPQGRTVTVTIMPKSALRIEQVKGPGFPDSAESSVNEIIIVGAYGAVMLQGDQVRKSFISESKAVYAIKYQ